MVMKTARDKSLPKRKVRVLIVDDHPIMRYGITRILRDEPDFAVCGEAADVGEALALTRKLKPDAIVLDISLKDQDGLFLARRIHRRWPNVIILIISMHDERIYARKAIQAGASGYLTKNESSSRLVEALRDVVAGNVYLSDEMKGRLIHSLSSPEGLNVVDILSNREREIFLMIGRGHTSMEIARTLGLSGKTVETHRYRIKQKLGLETSHRMVCFAVEWVRNEGLMPPAVASV